jgi:predicted MPP superfamily phosphohydrolase
MRTAPAESPAPAKERKGPRLWRAVASPYLLLIVALFALFDFALVYSLPLLGLSYGTEWHFPVLAAAGIRLAVTWCVDTGLALSAFLRERLRLPARAYSTRRVLWIVLALQLVLTAAELEAYLVEPFRMGTTTLDVASPKLDAASPPLRIVHLTDTHVERTTRRERALVARVNALEPDLIVLTGDYLNLSYANDPRARQDFRWLISQLRPKYGIYATRGSLEPTQSYARRLFEGTDIIRLENEHRVLDLDGRKLALVGVACCHDVAVDAGRLEAAMEGLPPDVFTLLLYHSPDLADHASQSGIDLYLAGHTHGGQIRAPVHGAIVTASLHGKRFEMGRYRVGKTLLYVSRGLGMEGSFAPRARFLCPPEAVSIVLAGE